MSVSTSMVVSVVSHGHGNLLQTLLQQLATQALQAAAPITRVVLTQNIPEPDPIAPASGWPFALELIRNAQPKGFGANHNQALAGARESQVCVLNPDVRVLDDGQRPFAQMSQVASEPGVGCAYPLQVDEHGVLQESERELPSPSALWRRRVLKQGQKQVDWVNAACMVIPADVWRSVQGFDEGYFMYCEDVDLSLRIRLLGLRLQRVPVRIEHAGQRASSRQWRHLLWHVRSLLRLWSSSPYRQMVARKN